MIPDTIGCVWTGEFELNTLRVNGRNVKVADSKISEYVCTGLKLSLPMLKHLAGDRHSELEFSVMSKSN